jgi:hypothetical protein
MPIEGADDDGWDTVLNTMTFVGIDSSVWTIKSTADAALPKAGGTLTGRVDALSSRSKIVALGSVSGTVHLDLSLGNYFTLESGGNITVDFTNVPSGSVYAQFAFLRWKNPGAHTLAFGAGSTWKLPVAGTPTWSATSDDYMVFVTEDAGTTWRLCGLKQAITS